MEGEAGATLHQSPFFMARLEANKLKEIVMSFMSTPTTSDVKFQNPHIGNTSCLIQSSIAPGEDTFEKGNCCEEDHLDSKHE